MLMQKLHLESSGQLYVETFVVLFSLTRLRYVLVEINDGLAKRILGDDVQPSALVLKWRVGTANRLMFLESRHATRLIQHDLVVMQEQQSKFFGSKKLGATLRRAFGGEGKKENPAAAKDGKELKIEPAPAPGMKARQR